MDELQKQSIDALITTDDLARPRQIVAIPLFEETIGPVCSPARAQLIGTAHELDSQPLLHTTSRPQAWAEWAKAQGLDPATFATSRQFDHLPLLLEAAVADLGIAIAPKLLVEREIMQERLMAPFGFTACGSSFVFCTTTARSKEPKLMLLRDWLQNEAESG